jgi:hypothetical protein
MRSSLTPSQAGAVALRLANEQSATLYHCQPFQDETPARFVAGHWVWTERKGYGHSDFQVKVELAADGSAPKVDLELLDSKNELVEF